MIPIPTFQIQSGRKEPCLYHNGDSLRSLANRFSWRVWLSAFSTVVLTLTVHAHSHNVSTGELKFSDQHIEARITFPADEIRAMLKLDQNGDGVVSPEELADQQQFLDALAPQIFTVKADGHPAKPDISRATVDVQNDVHFDLSFHFPPASRITLASGVVKKMPGFHRQFLSLKDDNGQPLKDILLNPLHDTLVSAGGDYFAPESTQTAMAASEVATKTTARLASSLNPSASVLSVAQSATQKWFGAGILVLAFIGVGRCFWGNLPRYAKPREPSLCENTLSLPPPENTPTKHL